MRENKRLLLAPAHDSVLLHGDPPSLGAPIWLGRGEGQWRQHCHAPTHVRVTHRLVDNSAQRRLTRGCGKCLRGAVVAAVHPQVGVLAERCFAQIDDGR